MRPPMPSPKMPSPSMPLIRAFVYALAINGLAAMPLAAAQPAPPTTGPMNVQPPETRTLPMAAASNAFGWKLYNKLAAGGGNVFFSPYSISQILTLTQRGARGATADQMASALALPTPWSDEAQRNLHAQLKDHSPADDLYTLSIANGLWVQDGMPIQAQYDSTAKDLFGASVQPADFVKSSGTITRDINHWVAERTAGKITDLFSAGDIDSQTRLVLANAVYFKGDWLYPFKSDDTHDLPFTRLDGTTATIPTMREEAFLGYAEEPNFLAVELPYRGTGDGAVPGTSHPDISMLLILPKAKDRAALTSVEGKLATGALDHALSDLRAQRLAIKLPKWEGTTRYDLASTLKSLGMSDAFAPKKADFSGITSAEQLSISSVVHQAVLQVDEKGTEAAAATGAVMRTLSMRALPALQVAFDHPFLYAVIHRPTGATLFLGRLEDPSKKK